MLLGRLLRRRALRYTCLVGAVIIILVLSHRVALPLPTRTPPPPAPSKVLGKHQYLPNGLLQVNEDGAHPIYELIESAEREWENKLKRASKTLQEAVKEYKHRYHRYPPKGFDLWWQYATKHNVRLPDEYDQIYNDLEPFWGLQPSELVKLRDELESKVDSYTLGKDSKGHVRVVNYAFNEGSYDQLIKSSVAIVDLFSGIEDMLPPFRAVISPHDNPNRLSDYFIRASALKGARNGEYVSSANLPRARRFGWRSACPPSSPAGRELEDPDEAPPHYGRKTFIYDHVRSMDPCLHPDHFRHHGQFLSHNEGPAPQETLVPEFAYCATTIHYDISMPNPYGWVDDITDLDWDDKSDERLLWRGSNTGIYHANHTQWQASHRNFLVQYANDLKGTLNILPPTHNRSERVGAPVQIRKSRVNPTMMDIAFAGKPLGCAPETCEQVLNMYPWREHQGPDEAADYKYVLDVDGNGWSGRFKRLMTSRSLIFKSTLYPEWYMGRVAPWVHYVPVKVDLSDLHDALVFFHGDGNDKGAHENLARKIAAAGREWSRTFWRREDLTAYYFRLMLEYGRLMSLDRESMTFFPQMS